MQEKTLEEEFIKNKIEDWKDRFQIETHASMELFITTALQEAREEGRKEAMPHVELIRQAWVKEGRTQYKEELLGKLPEVMRPHFTKVTSLTAKRRMTVRANGFNSCLSEVNKIIN